MVTQADADLFTHFCTSCENRASVIYPDPAPQQLYEMSGPRPMDVDPIDDTPLPERRARIIMSRKSRDIKFIENIVRTIDWAFPPATLQTQFSQLHNAVQILRKSTESISPRLIRKISKAYAETVTRLEANLNIPLNAAYKNLIWLSRRELPANKDPIPSSKRPRISWISFLFNLPPATPDSVLDQISSIKARIETYGIQGLPATALKRLFSQYSERIAMAVEQKLIDPSALHFLSPVYDQLAKTLKI